VVLFLATRGFRYSRVYPFSSAVGRSFEEAFQIGDFKPLLPVVDFVVGKLTALAKTE
jgi:hypothetical protein